MGNEIVLYSTGCPKCEVLKEKLKAKSVEYEEVNDVEKMKNLGIDFVPVLEVAGEKYSFKDAVDWVNSL